ncbi:MAG: carbohydrate ABC transporter permease [Clostridiaceae bacterium]|nr:carbohydrate ABC transporter permease [Clostridiaceae bacterium]
MNRKNSSYYIKQASLCIVLLLFLFPLLLALLNSFKSLSEIVMDPMTMPKTFNIDNYKKAFTAMKYPSAFLNSVIITLFSVVILCFFSSMTGHFFLRSKYKINKIMFALMIASMIIPFQAIMIPLVKVYGSLGLLNSRWLLIYLYFGFGTPLAVFMYHGFIKSIPVELEEAATIDGCTRFETYFKIVFPLLKPVTGTIVVLDILWIWNDYLLPYLILKSPKQRTLPLATFAFYGTHTADYGLLLAALVMTVTPFLILYVFLQKYIIAGIVQGAIK